MNIGISISGNLDALTSLDKQLVFATAKSLTQAAKEGQKAAVERIPRELNTTRPWYLPSNKFGVRIKPATKQNLQSEVYSDANWLAELATAQPHVAQNGGQVAIPTAVTRPLPIRRSNRPRGAAWRNAFILKTKSGAELIAKHIDGRLVIGYVLKRIVRRPKKDPLTSAVKQAVKEKFGTIFGKNLADAIRTAK